MATDVPEVQTELGGYLERLQILGATEDELMTVVATWDVFDEDWTPETRKRITRATDRDLTRMLLQSRVEYEHDTTEDKDWQPGMDVPPGDIPQLLAWVGDDPDRAYAAYQTERGRDEYARVELLAVLLRLAAPGDPIVAD